MSLLCFTFALQFFLIGLIAETRLALSAVPLSLFMIIHGSISYSNIDDISVLIHNIIYRMNVTPTDDVTPAPPERPGLFERIQALFKKPPGRMVIKSSSYFTRTGSTNRELTENESLFDKK
jgi:hypothetical protein